MRAPEMAAPSRVGDDAGEGGGWRRAVGGWESGGWGRREVRRRGLDARPREGEAGRRSEDGGEAQETLGEGHWFILVGVQ